jgi:hypothetical protein
MKSKLMILVLCCFICTVQLQSRTAHLVPRLKGASVQTHNVTLPPAHITYECLFRHIVNLETLASQKDQEGKDSWSIRNKIKSEFRLSNEQTTFLKSLALECVTRAQQLDDQAHQIIVDTRAGRQNGKLNSQAAPKCPVALYELQARRNANFETARVTLQQTFGDAQFAQFEDLLIQRYAKGIHKPVPHLQGHK